MICGTAQPCYRSHDTHVYEAKRMVRTLCIYEARQNVIVLGSCNVQQKRFRFISQFPTHITYLTQLGVVRHLRMIKLHKIARTILKECLSEKYEIPSPSYVSMHTHAHCLRNSQTSRFSLVASNNRNVSGKYIFGGVSNLDFKCYKAMSVEKHEGKALIWNNLSVIVRNAHVTPAEQIRVTTQLFSRRICCERRKAEL